MTAIKTAQQPQRHRNSELPRPIRRLWQEGCHHRAAGEPAAVHGLPPRHRRSHVRILDNDLQNNQKDTPVVTAPDLQITSLMTVVVPNSYTPPPDSGVGTDSEPTLGRCLPCAA